MENLKKKIQQAVDTYKSANLPRAEQMAKKLIDSNPKVVFLYNFLGLVLVGQGKIDQAIEYYEKGIKIDPNFAMIYNNLGLLFNEHKSDVKKAENYYNKSISLNQKIPEPHNNLGSLYKSQDKFDEAINCYKKAIAINPKFAHAYHNLGNIYTTMGDFAEAKKNFNKSIKIDPNYSNSHRTLGRLIKYTEDDEHFNELKKIYKQVDTNDVINRTNIAFALGKAYEDIKDFDKSFTFYNEANKTYRKIIKYSTQHDKDKFKEIKETFHRKLYEKYSSCGNNDLSSIFILGMPRSGTTLVEQILSNHPKVFGGDEQNFISKLLKKYFGSKDLKLFFEGVIDFDKNNFKKIGEEYATEMKNISNNSERATDKMPENFLWIGFIKLILPKSKIIHCYRNPKDNCLSIYKNHFPGGKINFSYDLDEIVEYYKLYSDLMNYWNDLLPNFVFNIKYENLITNTENEVRNLLKFCNLDWNENCLNSHNNKRPVHTASDVQARKKIFTSSINIWKNYQIYLNDHFKNLGN